jgi:MoaA/NifB/PqqE/SkfB family radical SAM enzyme
MIRVHNSAGYKWVFDTSNGEFMRWGKTKTDDPQYSAIGPEILDIEVSTICSQGCVFCYKSNLPTGKNMSFDTFKIIIDKMKYNLTQVAFGIGDLDANPDLRKMMAYCRSLDIIPNITINGHNLTDDWAEYLVSMCGAVSVSNYNMHDCYNTVEKLTNYGLKQCNIHQLLSAESWSKCHTLLYDVRYDERLAKLNAVVFLSLKKKGRGEKHTTVTEVMFNELVTRLLKENIRFGFDSCSAIKLMKYLEEHPEFKQLNTYIEPCEAGLFSSYVNVDGRYFPCSFSEQIGGGIDILKKDYFLRDVWNEDSNIIWRNILLTCKRNCPIYKI